MNTTLLATHVTAALALAVLLGVQCGELSRLRRSTTVETPRRVLISVAAIPILTVFVAITGGMLLRSGSHVGAWASAGIISSVAIFATALYAIVVLRRHSARPSGSVGADAAVPIAAAQWGTPCFALAAAYLMAARPDAVLPAVAPIALAVAVTLAFCLRAAGTRILTPDGDADSGANHRHKGNS